MTRDDMIRLTCEAGGNHNHTAYEEWCDFNMEQLARFAAVVAAAEREACAKLCDEIRKELLWQEGQTLPRGEPMLIRMAITADRCAAAIRARGGAACS